MRFSNPLARNPWPDDMVITVENHPLAVNLLLFIRHTWVIAVDAGIPELTPPPASGTSRVPDSTSPAEWESRWRTAWERAWAWYQIADSTRPELRQSSHISSVENRVKHLREYAHGLKLTIIKVP